MSIRDLEHVVDHLPYSIREDVIGYAHAVQAGLPDIFREARLRLEAEFARRVVFIAGIKKLYSLTASNFCVLDNSLDIASRADLGAVQVAGERIDRRSQYYRSLSELLRHFDVLIEDLGVRDLIAIDSLPELARALSVRR